MPLSERDMSCERADLLAGLVEDALDEDERAAVEAHVAGCAACAEALEGYRRTRSALSALPRPAPSDAARAAAYAAVLEAMAGAPASSEHDEQRAAEAVSGDGPSANDLEAGDRPVHGPGPGDAARDAEPRVARDDRRRARGHLLRFVPALAAAASLLLVLSLFLVPRETPTVATNQRQQVTADGESPAERKPQLPMSPPRTDDVDGAAAREPAPATLREEASVELRTVRRVDEARAHELLEQAKAAARRMNQHLGAYEGDLEAEAKEGASTEGTASFGGHADADDATAPGPGSAAPPPEPPGSGARQRERLRAATPTPPAPGAPPEEDAPLEDFAAGPQAGRTGTDRRMEEGRALPRAGAPSPLPLGGEPRQEGDAAVADGLVPLAEDRAGGEAGGPRPERSKLGASAARPTAGWTVRGPAGVRQYALLASGEVLVLDLDPVHEPSTKRIPPQETAPDADGRASAGTAEAEADTEPAPAPSPPQASEPPLEPAQEIEAIPPAALAERPLRAARPLDPRDLRAAADLLAILSRDIEQLTRRERGTEAARRGRLEDERVDDLSASALRTRVSSLFSVLGRPVAPDASAAELRRVYAQLQRGQGAALQRLRKGSLNEAEAAEPSTGPR